MMGIDPLSILVHFTKGFSMTATVTVAAPVEQDKRKRERQHAAQLATSQDLRTRVWARHQMIRLSGCTEEWTEVAELIKGDGLGVAQNVLDGFVRNLPLDEGELLVQVTGNFLSLAQAELGTAEAISSAQVLQMHMLINLIDMGFDEQQMRDAFALLAKVVRRHHLPRSVRQRLDKDYPLSWMPFLNPAPKTLEDALGQGWRIESKNGRQYVLVRAKDERLTRYEPKAPTKKR